MFKQISIAVVTLFVCISTASANDDLLSELAETQGSQIVDSAIEIVDLDGLDLDVDQLSEQATGEEDAIEACFRRFGYRSWGWGHRYYRPYYNCYSYYSRPIYNYCRPYVNYWGCF